MLLSEWGSPNPQRSPTAPAHTSHVWKAAAHLLPTHQTPELWACSFTGFDKVFEQHHAYECPEVYGMEITLVKIFFSLFFLMTKWIGIYKYHYIRWWISTSAFDRRSHSGDSLAIASWIFYRPFVSKFRQHHGLYNDHAKETVGGQCNPLSLWGYLQVEQHYEPTWWKHFLWPCLWWSGLQE